MQRLYFSDVQEILLTYAEADVSLCEQHEDSNLLRFAGTLQNLLFGKSNCLTMSHEKLTFVETIHRTPQMKSTGVYA